MIWRVIGASFGFPLECLGLPFSTDTAPGSWMGVKVAPGYPKRSLRECFLMPFQKNLGGNLRKYPERESRHSNTSPDI